MSKTTPDDPNLRSGRVGLVVAGMRHCVHNGYVSLISWSLSDCDRTIVALGPSDFLSHEARAAMLRTVFGPVLSFVFLEDIAAEESTDDWIEYVEGRISRHGLPEPTDYYTGSEIDARWYVSRFAALSDPCVENGRRRTFSSRATGRRLNLLDRKSDTTPAGSELGTLIQRRDDGWRLHVPAKLHRFVEMNYAPDRRVAVSCPDGFPEEGSVPVGTRCVLLREAPRTIYELKPDGKWRASHEAKSKSLNPPSPAGKGNGEGEPT